MFALYECTHTHAHLHTYSIMDKPCLHPISLQCSSSTSWREQHQEAGPSLVWPAPSTHSPGQGEISGLRGAMEPGKQQSKAHLGRCENPHFLQERPPWGSPSIVLGFWVGEGPHPGKSRGWGHVTCPMALPWSPAPRQLPILGGPSPPGRARLCSHRAPARLPTACTWL